MTNAEKFKEVFGFTPEPEFSCGCTPKKVCREQEKKHGEKSSEVCSDCPFRDWWNKEYKACFQIRSDYE